MIMRPRSQPTCTLAVFEDQPELAHKLCKAQFKETQGIFEGALLIKDNEYLVSTSEDRLEMFCIGTDAPKSIPGRRYAVITLPCGCGLRAQKFMIPPKITTCEFTDEVQYQYVNNMLSLHALFNVDSQAAKDITSVTRSRHMFDAAIPAYKTYRAEKWKGVAQSEESNQLDFNKTVSVMKANGMLFKTQTEAFSHDMSNADSLTEYATHPYVNILNTVMTVFATIACLYLLCRNNLMAMTVALAGSAMSKPSQSGKRGMSFDPISRTSTPRLDLTTQSLLDQIAILLSVVFCMLLIIFTFEVVKMIHRLCKYYGKHLYGQLHTTRSTMWLHIENDRTYINIKIANLPLPGTDCDMTHLATPELSRLHWSWLRGAVIVKWHGPNIVRSYQVPRFEYRVSDAIPLSYAQYGTLRNITNGDTRNVAMYIESMGIWRQLVREAREAPPAYSAAGDNLAPEEADETQDLSLHTEPPSPPPRPLHPRRHPPPTTTQPLPPLSPQNESSNDSTDTVARINEPTPCHASGPSSDTKLHAPSRTSHLRGLGTLSSLPYQEV